MELHIKGTYQSVYSYFSHLNIKEKGAWTAILLGTSFIIIGLLI